MESLFSMLFSLKNVANLLEKCKVYVVSL